MFGTSAEVNYDGISIPSLEPGKYENCTLDDVTFGKTTKGDGTEGKEIITFKFKTPEGMLHQKTEYAVTTADDKWESKIKNMQKRIGHIMSKFVPKDRLVQQSETFAAYGQWVVATLKSVAFKDVKVDILITGSVYQGKATSDFTGYPPFIAKAGDPLQFDNTGLDNNKKYYAFKAKQAGAAPDAEGGTPAAGGQYSTEAGPKADF